VEDETSAKAMALRNGLDLASSLGCNRLLVELDCMEVIEVMKNGGNSLSSVAKIYEECSFICRSFSNVSFSHYPRETNRTADSLVVERRTPCSRRGRMSL
jgi:hypothetical protein